MPGPGRPRARSHPFDRWRRGRVRCGAQPRPASIAATTADAVANRRSGSFSSSA
ncbi:hypothetical protein FTUN_0465 [Frigoriglobus tundricola]|uniref:Uncharacterized protein n=1 Tax=Frigoriglobus tundricola TaxID=2774151 RepID=A0A6M5YG08_9BACT|nr:hypothetical protein FTUN_0465 [Frigoriglobus tundricola]